MTNNQYIEKIISCVDRILVDTSTLMTNGFQQFIANHKEQLLKTGKSIIVPKAVYTELARHMRSTDAEKSELAIKAVELLTLNRDVFQIESHPLTEEEITRAFADTQLLSELTLHKQDFNQLLITNDRKLSCDAFDLNQQQSCKGRKVHVCYINWKGEMQCCECARVDRMSENSASEINDAKMAVNINGEPANPKMKWHFDWKSGALSIIGVGLLYGGFKCGKAFFQTSPF